MNSASGSRAVVAACTLDNTNWIANDKGGLYYGSAPNPGVNINGNTITRDKVVRREFRLAEGDAFNGFRVKPGTPTLATS